MSNSLLAWWMAFWRASFIVPLFLLPLGPQASSSGLGFWLVMGGPPIVAWLLRRAGHRVHAFPIIRALRSLPVLTDARTGQTVPLRDAFRTRPQGDPRVPPTGPQRPVGRPSQPWSTPNGYPVPPEQDAGNPPDENRPRPSATPPEGTPRPSQDGASGRPPHPNALRQASTPGRMTGFEPSALEAVPRSLSLMAYGFAGASLHAAGFSDQNRYRGQLGEVGFYKALVKEGLIDRFSSFWSVMLPAADGSGARDPQYEIDVDCVIVTGNDILLIDVKHFRAGGVTWHVQDGQLMCRDDATGLQVGRIRPMGRGMALAVSRYKSLFPSAQVSAYVVLVPTDEGEGTVEAGTTWAGGLPLMNLTDMLTLLRALPEGSADPDVTSTLKRLLEDQ